MNRKRARFWTAITAAALALAGAFVAAAPASADTSSLSGSGYNGGGTYYGSTARTNAQGQNEVFFQYTGMTPGGGSMHIYLVQGVNGYVYWDTTPTLNTWYQATYKPTGSIVWPNGTFYTAWSVNNLCGGSGCGQLTWTGNIEWNLKY